MQASLSLSSFVIPRTSWLRTGPKHGKLSTHCFPSLFLTDMCPSKKRKKNFTLLTCFSWPKLSVVKGQTGAATRDSGLSSVTGEPYGVPALGPQTPCWATLGSSDGTSESSWCFRIWGRAQSCQTVLKSSSNGLALQYWTTTSSFLTPLQLPGLGRAQKPCQPLQEELGPGRQMVNTRAATNSGRSQRRHFLRIRSEASQEA